MNRQPHPKAASETPQPPVPVKVFGVGGTGLKVLEQISALGLPGAAFVAVGSSEELAAATFAPEKIVLESKLLRGLGTGGDPERGRAVAEENLSQLHAACAGTGVCFIVTGLGGGGGTGISPVLARVAKSAGALVLAFTTLPFDCEGSRRRQQARLGIEQLKAEADGVICVSNQMLFKLIDERTSVVETFRLTNTLLAEGMMGVWRLIGRPGILPVHFDDLSALLRDRHLESTFATAQAAGPKRIAEAVDQLLAHPLLDGGKTLTESEAVLVSLAGGPDLAMAEVNQVMEAIQGRCGRAQVLMGAAIDEKLKDQLTITMIAGRRAERPVDETEPEGEPDSDTALTLESLETQLHSRPNGPRKHSRFTPPPPVLPPDKVEQLMVRQTGRPKGRKASARMRQGQLPLEIVSKGRFDKSEPTIHKGEDLDVPTYIRRGVSLN